MATERLSMRQTREILRQKWRLGRTLSFAKTVSGPLHGPQCARVWTARGVGDFVPGRRNSRSPAA